MQCTVRGQRCGTHIKHNARRAGCPSEGTLDIACVRQDKRAPVGCQRRPRGRPWWLSGASAVHGSASCWPGYCNPSRAGHHRKRNQPANRALICSREAVGTDNIWVRRAAAPPTIAATAACCNICNTVRPWRCRWALTVRPRRDSVRIDPLQFL